MLPSLRVLLVGLPLLFLLAAGCANAGKGTVKGKITVKGKALPRGLITFESQVGRRDSYSAAIINGDYETVEIPAGLAKISIVPSLISVTEGPPAEAKGGDLHPPVHAKKAEKIEVPEKYHLSTTSSLEMTIKPGENYFNQDLEP
jgi:hypothetical protein